MARNIYDNAKVTRWDEIPPEWKNVEVVAKKNFEYDPKDSRLFKVFDNFMGKDIIRPVMSGIYFDKNAIAITDAHRLFYKNVTHGVKEGIYGPDGRVIEGKYPAYNQVIKTYNDYSYKIDVLKLKTYCQAIQRGLYSNQTTHQIKFKYNNNKAGDNIIGFNSKFLVECLDTIMALGYREVWFGFSVQPSRAVQITPDKDFVKKKQGTKNNEEFISGKDWLMLLMPVIVNNEYGGNVDIEKGNVYGAEDLDFEYSCTSYFDFTDNEIHNADGSVAEFDENMTDVQNPIFSNKEFGIFKRIIGKNSIVPILENIAVENKTARITNLNLTYSKPADISENGLYQPINGSLRLQKHQKLDEYPVAFHPDVEWKPKFIVSTYTIKNRFNILENFIGHDDLRPVFSGLNITTEKGYPEIQATDASILCRLKFDMEYNKDEDLTGMIIPEPKLIHDIISEQEDQPVTAEYGYAENQKYPTMIRFSNDGWFISIRTIEGKFPNTLGVIPVKSNETYDFKYSDLKNVITESKKIKSTGRDKARQIFFNIESTKNKFSADLAYNFSGYNGPEPIRDKKPISTGAVMIGPGTEVHINNSMLIMAVMQNKDEHYLFGLQEKYLELVLALIPKNDIIKLQQYNKALIFTNGDGSLFDIVPPTGEITTISQKNPYLKHSVPNQDYLKKGNEPKEENITNADEINRARARARIRILKLQNK